MVQAMEFMNAVKDFSHIDEIKDKNEWRTKVMEELNKPIILDCYADWC
jgi:thiol:disulfide interchange protein